MFGMFLGLEHLAEALWHETPGDNLKKLVRAWFFEYQHLLGYIVFS